MAFESRVINPQTDEDNAIRAVEITWHRLQRQKGKSPEDVYLEMFNEAVVCTGLYDEAERVRGATTHMRLANYAILLTIAVDRQREGLGSVLLEAVEQQVVAEGATQMALTPDSDDARAFFLARDYIVSPDLDGTPQEGELLVKNFPASSEMTGPQ